jgi:uncharacterized damage-inducible protein DinB
MDNLLEQHFQGLQVQTRLLLKEVSALSTTTYHYQPGKNKWSISQILTHIMVAEKLSLAYMKKKSLGMNEIDDAGFFENLKLLLLKISQRLPFRFKAPKVVLEKTPAPLSFGDLVRQWESSRSEMHGFLNQIEKKNIHKKIYKHPVVGRLSVVHAVQFFTEHLNHHKPQVLTIIEEVKRKKFEKTAG